MALQVQPQDKTVTANCLQLHDLEWGSPAQPPMVLLHGLRGHAHSWDDVSAPIPVVRGADSDIVSAAGTQQMLAAPPHVREVEIPRAGHMVFEDTPDAFLVAVHAFLYER